MSKNKKGNTLSGEVSVVLSDICNKLTPFWTLISLVAANDDIEHLGEIGKIIKSQARSAERQKSIILADIDKISNISEKYNNNKPISEAK